MHIFTKSPSLNGFEATAISLVIKYLAFTAMSLIPANKHRLLLFEESHSGDEGCKLSVTFWFTEGYKARNVETR